jgi:hypothetical protein
MKASPTQQIAGFIGKFDPAVAKVIRAARTALGNASYRRRNRLRQLQLPRFGFSASERPSDCIVCLAAASNGAGLSFYYGATLPDPDGILQGSGKQNRFVRLPSATALSEPAVAALIDAAVKQAKTPLPKNGRGYTIIKSVSAKQRPRRRSS